MPECCDRAAFTSYRALTKPRSVQAKVSLAMAEIAGEAGTRRDMHAPVMTTLPRKHLPALP